MKKKDKVAIGCLAGLGLLGVTVIVMILTGWGAILKNTVVLGVKANAMVGLARRTPFSPAPGACLTEVQLKAYLEVCRRVKPAGDRVDDWEDTNQAARRDGKPVFKGQAAGLVGDFVAGLAAALQEQGMGPAEFAWVAARATPAATESSQSDPCVIPERAIRERYADRIQASTLGEHARRIALGFADR
jgi:hypothetical protein